jgi:hypothetical protein
MVRSMGFPKLEVGLYAMTKDDLADSLAYNSLKVQKVIIFEIYVLCNGVFYIYVNSFIFSCRA